MLDLIRIHAEQKDINNAIPVFIITKNGSDYNDKGIDFVKNTIKKDLKETGNLAVMTGKIINRPEMLRNRLKSRPESYVVLSTRDNVIFIPKEANDSICENIDEKINDPKSKKHPSTWEILMESCKQELY